jgi:DNA (cytosine-5)-methyltransferase 1
MRPKSGQPKRRALRRMPKWDYAFRENPRTVEDRHPAFGGTARIEGPSSSVVSVFSGAGGLDLGLLGGFRAGGRFYRPLPFQLIAAYDHDERAVETYRLNLSADAECRDLTQTPAEELPSSDVFVGGFPCQDFSSCGYKKGFAGDRGRLYRVMVDYLTAHQPQVVVAENVPHLARMHQGNLLREIVADFSEAGYKMDVWILNAPDFGLPQSRTRVFLIGVREDVGGWVIPPEPTHRDRHVPIEEALDDLMPIEDESIPNQSQYFVATRATAGAGQGDQVSRRGQVAYTVRANAKARVHFHYELDRRLTVRECARLQGFPDEFVFPYAAMTNMLHIGNAVPPILGHVVGSAVAAFMGGTRNERHEVTPVVRPEFLPTMPLFDVEELVA